MYLRGGGAVAKSFGLITAQRNSIVVDFILIGWRSVNLIEPGPDIYVNTHIYLRLKKECFFLLINQMELTYVTIVVLASMVFILSGMVGYLYWQQTRMLQHLQSLALALASHIEQTNQQIIDDTSVADETEDDRVSVTKEQVEVVEGPPTATEPSNDDVDDIHEKTSAQLRDLLTKKGIPFGKRDSKTVLLELLKASS